MNTGRCVGRVAVVTGGAAGIGRATALRLASEGASVFVIDLDEVGAKSTVAQIEGSGGTATAMVIDLADPSQRAGAIPAAIDRFGQVDILVNNAAYHGHRTALLDISDSDWDRVLATNVTATMVLSRGAARDMVPRGAGVIINLTSLQEELPLVTFAAYGASKGAIAALTRALATELSPHGIRVNSVQPAVIATGGYDLNLGGSTTVTPAATLLGRAGTPDEVSSTVVFLASDEASFITGIDIPVDGGRRISRLPDPLADRYNQGS